MSMVHRSKVCDDFQFPVCEQTACLSESLAMVSQFTVTSMRINDCVMAKVSVMTSVTWESLYGESAPWDSLAVSRDYRKDAKF